jgi:hypothetical protein
MKNIYAYTAGYIEGDGCFYIGKTLNKKTGKFKYQSKVIIASTNSDILKFFAQEYNGSFFISDIRDKFNNQKPQFQCVVSGKSAAAMINNIYPFLPKDHVGQHKVAENFMDFVKNTCEKNRDNCIEWARRIKPLDDIHQDMIDFHMKYRSTIVPTEQDFAFLAGYIDAECSLGIQEYMPKNKPNRVYKIILQCNNTREYMCPYLLERFGGFACFVPRTKNNPNHRDQFSWRLSGKQLANIIPSIYPFLRYKKQVCDEIMKFIDTVLPNGGARHTEIFRSGYEKVLKQREEIVQKIHKLNRKGIL